jgi:hypothetical protein
MESAPSEKPYKHYIFDLGMDLYVVGSFRKGRRAVPHYGEK